MTEFLVEKTGKKIRVQLSWDENGRAGEFLVLARAPQTEIGDLLRHPGSGERFLLGEHNFNGLLFRAKPHYRIGFFRVTDIFSLWRQKEPISQWQRDMERELVADNLPAVVSVGAPLQEETPSRLIIGQNLRIATQDTDIRIGDKLVLSRTGSSVRVEAVDDESWQGGLVLVYGTVWM